LPDETEPEDPEPEEVVETVVDQGDVEEVVETVVDQGDVEEVVETVVDQGDVEEVVETYSGRLMEEGVLVEDPRSLVELAYGFPEDGGQLLPDVDVLHLQRRGVLQVMDGDKEVPFDTILNRGLSLDDSFFLKYIVFRDMRSKGRRIRTGLGDMPYLWFYEKPSRPCSHMVAVYSRNQSIPLDELENLLAIGGRFKKGVYLALVDEEGEVSYYEIKRFAVRPGEAPTAERVDEAQLVGPMAVVWDPTGAVSLYREGYFGKPIGIRKPRSMDFERPITLSFIESVYLSEKARITLGDASGGITSGDLVSKADGEESFRERFLVYKMLKDAGLIVKSGMKFGVDFAVYEYGPGLDHAPFLIHV
jgi:tRNA-intron endonuclease